MTYTQHSYVQVAKDTEIPTENVSMVVDAVLASITKALVSGNKVSEPFNPLQISKACTQLCTHDRISFLNVPVLRYTVTKLQ